MRKKNNNRERVWNQFRFLSHCIWRTCHTKRQRRLNVLFTTVTLQPAHFKRHFPIYGIKNRNEPRVSFAPFWVFFASDNGLLFLFAAFHLDVQRNIIIIKKNWINNHFHRFRDEGILLPTENWIKIYNPQLIHVPVRKKSDARCKAEQNDRQPAKRTTTNQKCYYLLNT